MSESSALVPAGGEPALAGTAGLHVVFAVGDAEYVVPAGDVVQMETFTAATPVPGTPDWVLGLMQVRNRVMPVIDLRRRFGLPPAAPAAAPVAAGEDLDARVVVVARGSRIVALRVDRAREVVDLPAASLTPVPAALAASTGGFVGGIARAGNRLLLVLDLDGVLGQETFHAQ